MPAEISPLDRLQRFVERYPSQRAAADALGIAQSYLHELLNQSRPISDRVLGKLGLQRVVVPAKKGGKP